MIKEAIVKLSKKEDLTYQEAETVMDEIMSGQATAVQMSSYLTALSMKGETIDEITASAAGMRAHCIKLLHDLDVLEIVGTGGDGSNSFNISTTSSLVIAAAGVPVAKHGNRAASSKSGAADVLEALEKDGVTLFPYDSIYEYVKTFKKDKKVLLCKKKVNSRLVSNIPADTRILDEENLTLLPKATKNPVEVENERIAHIRDGVAVTKFIYWLKKNVGRIPITELSAAEKLYEFRSEQEDFIDNSFDPIIAYGKHAAIVHYFATPETDIPLEPSGFLLADTGGHYKEGTTDITRTVVMGPTTEEEKKYFTAVLRGTLNLGAARFLHGCTGVNLDILARQPLWEMGEDFKHGTGHGVGYLLNVHEGPNSFRWKIVPGGNAVLEEGMITSDEPGYYREDGFGIRHENLMVCKKAEKTEYGQFMCFEFLTMVPFDLDGVVPELMSVRERNLLNDYHAQVYEKISPYLNEEEKEWLKDATRAI